MVFTYKKYEDIILTYLMDIVSVRIVDYVEFNVFIVTMGECVLSPMRRCILIISEVYQC